MALVDDQLTEKEAARQLREERNQTSQDIPADETGTIGDTINAGDPSQAARRLREEKNNATAGGGDAVAADQRRAEGFGGQLREARQAIRALSSAPQSLQGAVEGIAEGAIVQAQQRVWGIAMEITEDLTISVWPLAFLLGFIPVVLLVLRAVLAYPLRAFFTVTINGVNVSLAPPFTPLDFALRIKGILAYGAWALEWVLIVIIVTLINEVAS